MNKDYYKILELNDDCTEADIKASYRRLARKWHPDIAGNTDQAIKTFKEINEAYEVLSDKIRRENFDRAKKFYNYSSSPKEDNTKKEETNSKSTNTQKNSEFTSFGFNWQDFIQRKYQEAQFSKKQKEIKTPQKGNNVYADVEISVIEAIEGTTKVVNMIQTHVCQKCGGRKFVNGGTCPHCNGKGERSVHKRFNVKIPHGIKDGSKIRLSGEGDKGINGGRDGDLYLTVHIKQDNNFKTEGLNIIKQVAINPFEAVLGTNISVQTLVGNVTVKISPNTQNGQKIRLSGCGIQSGIKTGDMILVIEIQIPKTLSEEEISLYKKLQQISSSNVR